MSIAWVHCYISSLAPVSSLVCSRLRRERPNSRDVEALHVMLSLKKMADLHPITRRNLIYNDDSSESVKFLARSRSIGLGVCTLSALIGRIYRYFQAKGSVRFRPSLAYLLYRIHACRCRVAWPTLAAAASNVCRKLVSASSGHRPWHFDFSL